MPDTPPTAELAVRPPTRRDQIRQFFADHPDRVFTTAEVAERFGLHPRQVGPELANISKQPGSEVGWVKPGQYRLRRPRTSSNGHDTAVASASATTADTEPAVTPAEPMPAEPADVGSAEPTVAEPAITEPAITEPRNPQSATDARGSGEDQPLVSPAPSAPVPSHDHQPVGAADGARPPQSRPTRTRRAKPRNGPNLWTLAVGDLVTIVGQLERQLAAKDAQLAEAQAELDRRPRQRLPGSVLDVLTRHGYSYTGPDADGDTNREG